MTPPTDRSSQEGLPKPGDVVADRYQVERLIGEGGMGAVFAARDLEVDEAIALKVLLPEMTEYSDSTKRFMREVRAARAIDSPHVARLLDAGKLETGVPFMVLENRLYLIMR